MYIRLIDQVRLTESEIRAAHPNTSFSSPFVPPPEYAVVFQSPRPQYSSITHGLREVAPEFVNGNWEQRWEVFPLPSDVAEASMLTLKRGKNDYINESRFRANFSSFTHAGKTFACDALSRSDIDGINGYVALVGDLPPGWPGAWKATDNTYHPIPDVTAWGAFYAAMVAAGNANFAKAQTLKAQLEAATTPEAVYAVQW